MRPLLHAGLQQVLTQELASGNHVVEDTEWPPTVRRFVMLERPFHQPHDATALGIVHRRLDDPHHWLAEYAAPDGTEVLACRFR